MFNYNYLSRMMDTTETSAPEDDNSREGALGQQHRIIVIGASAGGFETIKTLVRGLPPDFSTPIIIVWHMAPDIRGVMPNVLNKVNTIHAAHAVDGEVIKLKRIYIAPPDHHLLIEEGKLRLSRGPKENHFRPAVDPLFRSAAYTYGNRVIGIVLSGALDDGTAGIWRIKHSGGLAIVQDPHEAEVPSMPESAMRKVGVDHCVSITEMAALLVQICGKPVENTLNMRDDKTKIEIGIAAGEREYDRASLKIGELSPLTCPDCNGVLSKITEGNITRFRCHTGHAYSVDTLLSLITEKIEKSLFSAVSGIEESMMLLNHIGDHLAEVNHAKLAALYFKKAKEAEGRAAFLKSTIMGSEQLSNNSLLRELQDIESHEE